MIDNFIDGLVSVIGIIFLFIMFGILTSILLLPIYFFEKKECKEIAKRFNYKYEFTLFTGCILEKPNGNKFLLEKLRSIEEK